MTSAEQLYQTLEENKEDFVKAYGGNKAAGTRVRKVLMEIRELAKGARDETLAISKGEEDASEIEL